MMEASDVGVESASSCDSESGVLDGLEFLDACIGDDGGPDETGLFHC